PALPDAVQGNRPRRSVPRRTLPGQHWRTHSRCGPRDDPDLLSGTPCRPAARLRALSPGDAGPEDRGDQGSRLLLGRHNHTDDVAVLAGLPRWLLPGRTAGSLASGKPGA